MKNTLLITALGTIYVKYPGVTKVIVSGKGTETTSLTSSLDTVYIEEGAFVSIDSGITIANLYSKDSDSGDICKLTVTSGNTLTTTNIGKLLYFCKQLSIAL